MKNPKKLVVLANSFVSHLRVNYTVLTYYRSPSFICFWEHLVKILPKQSLKYISVRSTFLQWRARCIRHSFLMKLAVLDVTRNTDKFLLFDEILKKYARWLIDVSWNAQIEVALSEIKITLKNQNSHGLSYCFCLTTNISSLPFLLCKASSIPVLRKAGSNFSETLFIEPHYHPSRLPIWGYFDLLSATEIQGRRQASFLVQRSGRPYADMK